MILLVITIMIKIKLILLDYNLKEKENKPILQVRYCKSQNQNIRTYNKIKNKKNLNKSKINKTVSIQDKNRNKQRMRRCITPNPHVKSKYLSELINMQNSNSNIPMHQVYPQRNKINYDSFIYVDRLTNNRIVLGDVKNMYNCTQGGAQPDELKKEQEGTRGSNQRLLGARVGRNDHVRINYQQQTCGIHSNNLIIRNTTQNGIKQQKSCTDDLEFSQRNDIDPSSSNTIVYHNKSTNNDKNNTSANAIRSRNILQNNVNRNQEQHRNESKIINNLDIDPKARVSANNIQNKIACSKIANCLLKGRDKGQIISNNCIANRIINNRNSFSTINKQNSRMYTNKYNKLNKYPQIKNECVKQLSPFQNFSTQIINLKQQSYQKQAQIQHYPLNVNNNQLKEEQQPIIIPKKGKQNRTKQNNYIFAHIYHQSNGFDVDTDKKIEQEPVQAVKSLLKGCLVKNNNKQASDEQYLNDEALKTKNSKKLTFLHDQKAATDICLENQCQNITQSQKKISTRIIQQKKTKQIQKKGHISPSKPVLGQQLDLSKAIENFGLSIASKRHMSHIQSYKNLHNGAAHHSHGHAQTTSAFKLKQYSHSKQMEEINDCFAIMKSTKLFQMDNLKNRLFQVGNNGLVVGEGNGNRKSNEDTINQNNGELNNQKNIFDFQDNQKGETCKTKNISKNKYQKNGNRNSQTSSKSNKQIDDMIKKKKKIRQFIQQYLNNLSLNQFRRYMQHQSTKNSQRPQTHKPRLINPSILNLHKTLPTKISKNNLQKIIQQLIFSTENNHERKKPRVNINMDDIEFPQEERLKELLMQRMFIKNQDFQYLVRPQGRKQVFGRIIRGKQKKDNLIGKQKRIDIKYVDLNYQQSKKNNLNTSKYSKSEMVRPQKRTSKKRLTSKTNKSKPNIKTEQANNTFDQNINRHKYNNQNGDENVNLNNYHFNELNKDTIMSVIKESRLCDRKDVDKIFSESQSNTRTCQKNQLCVESNIQNSLHCQMSLQDKKLKLKTKELLLSIQAGSIYDFLFLIIRWPSLLHYRDKQGNNLLHITSKTNQSEIYSLLIKKLGVEKLREKNNCGRSPIQLAELFGSEDVVKVNLAYQDLL